MRACLTNLGGAQDAGRFRAFFNAFVNAARAVIYGPQAKGRKDTMAQALRVPFGSGNACVRCPFKPPTASPIEHDAMLADPPRFSASSTRLNSTVLPGAVSYALTIRGPLHVDAPNIAVCPLLPDEQSCSCSVSSTSTDPERLIGAAMVRSLVANKPLSQRQDALARIRHTPDAKPREPRGQPTSECDASALPSHSQRVDGGDELVEVERLAVASVAAEFVGDLRRGRQRREHDDFRAG